VSARSEARKVLDHSKTGITCSNPARGMDVFKILSVALSPVGGDLRVADSLCKEYQQNI
jgi:hypothetical protein